jgi:hypothetical protein
MMARPNATSAGRPATKPNRRHHHPSLETDPDGYLKDFGFDVMRRTGDDGDHSAVSWVARQLRMSARYEAGAKLSHAVPCDDLVYTDFLVPDSAPALMADPHAFWSALQERDLGPRQHLWGGPTIWFPGAANWHVPARRVREFVQATIVDRLSTPAQMVVHDPGLIGKAGDLHVHVMISSQRLETRGFAGFEPEVVYSGCQRRMWQAWQAWQK